MNNMKLKACATILAATLATAANAGVVTEWDYNNQAGFSDWEGTTTSYGDLSATDDDVAASGDSSGGGTNILDTDLNGVVDGADAPLATTLDWGTPAASSTSGLKSSLDIDSPVEGSMSTNDSNWADGTDIIHNNWVINDDTLTGATVLDGLSLTPSAWDANGADEALLLAESPYLAPQLQFGVNFIETVNFLGQSNTCPNGTVNGAGDNINGCGDIFEITGLEDLPFTPVVSGNTVEFTVPFVLTAADGSPIEGWSDTTYFVTTRLSGLTLLGDEYNCSNAQESCFGFVTVEEQVNILDASFKIATRINSVPEPSTLAIFGLGIIGFSLFGRKKA